LTLTRVLNFRDIGGVPGADGRLVRRGCVYRSGELNALTEADLQTLAPLAIRAIFDLRTDSERTIAPTIWNHGTAPVVIPISVGFDAHENPAASMKDFFARGVEPSHAAMAMQATAAKIAINGAPAIGRILRAIGQGETPALIHCTAGKDRTGVVSAMLLLLLGVAREAVYEDYLRSNEAVPAQIARLTDANGAPSGMPPVIASLPIGTIRVLFSVERTFLDAGFAAIETQFGSFDAYVADGLRLTPEDLQILRTRLLT
jgi:protein-tyrosine phosphatase